MMTRQQMKELRSCQCNVPCIVYCNVILKRILEELE